MPDAPEPSEAEQQYRTRLQVIKDDAWRLSGKIDAFRKDPENKPFLNWNKATMIAEEGKSSAFILST